jgi:hypothetical protein
MAMSAGASRRNGLKQSFGMRSLLRLALWGTAAAGALTFAALAAFSDNGLQRLKGRGQSGAQQTVEGARGQPTAAELETRKLAETVQALSADRERLLTRIASLEHNLDDITGSIKRQAAATPPAAPPAPPPGPSATPAPSAPAAPAPIPASAKPVPAEVAAVAPAVVPEPAAPPSDGASVPATDQAPLKIHSDIGVDVGGAVSFEGLRGLWHSHKSSQPELFDKLHPLVVVRENAKTHSPEMRLIAGPLPDVDAATRLCATLTAARRYCRPAAYEGEQISLHAPEPAPRRPVASQQRKSGLKSGR